MLPVRYQTGVRVPIVGVSAVFAVTDVALVIDALGGTAGSGGGPPHAFELLFVTGTLYCMYWLLLREAIDLEITDGGRLRWAGVLRKGEVWLDDLTEVRPHRWMGGTVRFGVRGQGPILISPRKGIGDFLSALEAVRPDLPVTRSLLMNQ